MSYRERNSLFNLTGKSVVSEHLNNGNVLKVLEFKPEEFDHLVTELIDALPDCYIDPEALSSILDRLGKPATAQKLRVKIPETKKIRSGDIGEILSTDYIEEATDYSVPIHKLRWRDHRNMAMRGDDVIAVLVNQGTQKIQFLKVEAKSNKAMSRVVLQKARDELDLDGGLPSPHALGFVADRLREIGKNKLSDLIEKAQLFDGIRTNQVEHLLFTFTASNPETLQKKAFEDYSGDITQISVGLRLTEHQELIANVYQGVIDGLDD